MFEKYYKKANAAIKASEKQKETVLRTIENAASGSGRKKTIWGLPPRAVYTTAVCLVIVLVAAFLIPKLPRQATPILPSGNMPGSSSTKEPSGGDDGTFSPSSGREDGSSSNPPVSGISPDTPDGSVPYGGGFTDPPRPPEDTTEPSNNGSGHPGKPEPPPGPTDPIMPPSTDPVAPPEPSGPEPTDSDPTGNPSVPSTDCPTDPTMPTEPTIAPTDAATDPTEPTGSTVPDTGQTIPTEPPV